MPELSFLTNFRDIVIIVFGLVGLLALTVFLIFTVLIGFAAWKLIKAARGTITEGVGPLLENAEETARNVQGTAAFVTDTVVSPLIKVYATVAGIRRGLGMLTRVRGK